MKQLIFLLAVGVLILPEIVIGGLYLRPYNPYYHEENQKPCVESRDASDEITNYQFDLSDKEIDLRAIKKMKSDIDKFLPLMTKMSKLLDKLSNYDGSVIGKDDDIPNETSPVPTQTQTNPDNDAEVMSESPASIIDEQQIFEDCFSSCILINLTFVFQPVCGTDGLMYRNLEQLKCAQQCGKNVKIAFFGMCQEPEEVY